MVESAIQVDSAVTIWRRDCVGLVILIFLTFHKAQSPKSLIGFLLILEINLLIIDLAFFLVPVPVLHSSIPDTHA